MIRWHIEFDKNVEDIFVDILLGHKNGGIIVAIVALFYN